LRKFSYECLKVPYCLKEPYNTVAAAKEVGVGHQFAPGCC
jgi:hypothetical protein